jgi:hypothetical protein
VNTVLTIAPFPGIVGWVYYSLREEKKMKNVIRVLAKEVRRVRALVEFRTSLGIPPGSFEVELNTLRRVLVMLIREQLCKRN